MEPLGSGKVPPGFDPTTCRSVYIGNIHSKVTEGMLADIFSNLGPLESCKLIRKDKSSYGFVDFLDHQSAASALANLNGRHLFGQPIKVNWAFQGSHQPKEEQPISGMGAPISIFVGDLGNEVNDIMLFQAFSHYPTCAEAKVMWDHKTGRSRGYGFVTFRSQVDAEAAMAEMTGKWVGSRPVRCNWATRGLSAGLGQHQGAALDGQQPQLQGGPAEDASAPSGGGDPASKAANGAAPAKAAAGGGPGAGVAVGKSPVSLAPQFTTVYVGNLAPEVSQPDLHRAFYSLGVGAIEEVKVNREKGFGFVRYRVNEEAAAAIQAANGQFLCGRPVRCSWGSKPSIPTPGSQGLPPPPPLSGPPLGAAAQAGYGPIGQGAGPNDMVAFQQRMRGNYGSGTLSAQGGGMPQGMPMGGMPMAGMGGAMGMGAVAGVGPMGGPAAMGAGPMQGMGSGPMGAMGSGMGAAAMGLGMGMGNPSMGGAMMGPPPGLSAPNPAMMGPAAAAGPASGAGHPGPGYGQQMYF